MTKEAKALAKMDRACKKLRPDSERSTSGSLYSFSVKKPIRFRSVIKKVNP